MSFDMLTVYMAVYNDSGICFEETKTANLKQGDFVSVSQSEEGALCACFIEKTRKVVVLKNHGRYIISDATQGVVIF